MRLAPILAAALLALSACGSTKPAESPHDDDELPDPEAPTDLGELQKPAVDGPDQPLVDPAKEMGRPASSSAPRPSR